MKYFLTMIIFGLASCSLTHSQKRDVANQETVIKKFLNHPSDPTKKIEYFIDTPKLAHPLKTIFLIHGHQYPQRNGGYDFVKWGILDKWKNRGYLAVSISQLGYGESDGPPDYCGQLTQEAIIAVKNELIKKGLSNPRNITLLGFSRGAMVSGMVASREKDIKNLIMIAGAYDLEALYNNLPESPIKRNIRIESGTEPYQFRSRSVLSHAEKIKARTIILHGKKDREPTFHNAHDLFLLLKRGGNQIQFNAFDSGHMPPRKERNQIIDKFLLHN